MIGLIDRRLATVFGGSHDGREVECGGYRFIAPFTDEQHQREYREWHDQWGVAAAFAQAFDDWDTYDKIPKPPRFPREVYVWLPITSKPILAFAGVER